MLLTRVKRRVDRYVRTVNQWRGIMDPNEVYRRGNEPERNAFFEIGKRKNLDGYRARVALMEQLDVPRRRASDHSAGDGLRLPEIPRDKGIMLTRPEGFSLLDEALAEARRDFQGYVPGTNKRQYDSLQGVPRSDLTYKSAINRLATHPEVLRVVSKYMGMLPILHRITVLYSANDEEVEKSSQFFHLDPEDVIMTKIFVYVEDVDRDTGPTTALPADRSTVVRRRIDYRNSRVPDEVIAEHGGTENLIECTGPAGTMAFLDTCRCFHMGSRKAAKPRYVIMIQYQTPYAAPAAPDGPLPVPRITHLAIPPNPSPLEQYLYALKR
jgi:hypothetical protein